MSGDERQRSTQGTMGHDALAKLLLTVALQGRGRIESQVSIASAPQYADLFFEPSGEAPAPTPRIALIAQMANGPCLLEPYRKTPGEREVLDCLCKHLVLDRQRRNSLTPYTYEMARLWILSPGKPKTALASFGCSADRDGWCDGFYALADAFHTHIVVISELPKTPQTLVLRLLGRGKVQKQALRELYEQTDDVSRDPFWQTVLQWRLVLEDAGQTVNDELQEFLMNLEQLEQLVEQRDQRITQQALQKGHEAGLQEGRQEGRQEGLLAGLQDGRLKALREMVLEAYEARFGAAPERVREVIESAGEATLHGWFPQVITQPQGVVLNLITSAAAP